MRLLAPLALVLVACHGPEDPVDGGPADDDASLDHTGGPTDPGRHTGTGAGGHTGGAGHSARGGHTGAGGHSAGPGHTARVGHTGGAGHTGGGAGHTGGPGDTGTGAHTGGAHTGGAHTATPGHTGGAGHTGGGRSTGDTGDTPSGDTGVPTADTGPAAHTGAPDEVCVGGDDEDGDGAVDCADTDCAADPACAPPTVGVTCAPTANGLRWSCAVTVDPPGPAHLEVSRSADGTGLRTADGAAPLASHDLAVVFLASATEYRAVATSGAGRAETTFVTDALPADVDSRLTVVGAASVPYVGAMIPCDTTHATAGVWDTVTGELVWWNVADDASFDGYSMVRFTPDHTVLGVTGQNVVELDLLGNDVRRVPYGTDDFHHDVYRRDGHTWLLYHDRLPGLTLDGFVVWDPDGGELGRYREVDHLPIPVGAAGDWSHTNTIFVDPDWNVYLSLLHQNTLVKLDGDPASPTFGQTEWILAGDLPMALGNDFLLDWAQIGGVDAFSHQHEVSVRDDGRLQLLDNQNGRVLVLDVDEGARTATPVESYATSVAPCGPQGTSATSAADGRFAACNGDTLYEYDPLGTAPRWESTLVCANGYGNGGPVPGPIPNLGVMRWYPLEGW